MKESFTKSEIEQTRESIRHIIGGFIGISRAAEGPQAVRLAEQIRDVLEADFSRLLRGVAPLQDHIHAHLNPDHGDLPICGNHPKCRDARNCKECAEYEDFKDKLRDNFREK